MVAMWHPIFELENRNEVLIGLLSCYWEGILFIISNFHWNAF